MLRFALFFAAGTLAFHQISRLPDAWGLVWGLGASLLIGLATRAGWVSQRAAVKGLLQGVAAGLLGFSWSHASALLNEPPRLPDGIERLETTLDGRIRGLPEVRHDVTRFVFETPVLPLDSGARKGRWRFRIAWHNAPPLQPGERWSLSVRLRAVHGYASPGAWDYEGWLYHQGIRYTGYVRDAPVPRRLAQGACCTLDRLRSSISHRIDAMPLSPFTRGVLRALVVADRSGLDPAARALFRDTGTSHLMAVSGLHIGLIAGVAMGIVGFLWRRHPRLCERVPARLPAVAVGLLAATGYAGLAGFGLPTQRALIMLTVFASGILLRRETRVAHGLAIALVLVLVWHPPSIVAPGLWLSFGAVIAIVVTLAWTRERSRVVQGVAVQAGITLALWPLLVHFELPASGAAPLVNLVLVPVFGLLIVPWSLLGGVMTALSPPLAHTLLVPLDGLLTLIEQILQTASEWSFSLPTISLVGQIGLAVGIGILLLPPGFPLRWTGLPLLLVAWVPRAAPVAPGDFHFHLLDVGQGLSAVVETHRRVLIFDTGPAYRSGFSAASAVIVPFLRRRGHPAVDRLIVSHGDADHGGGTEALRQEVAVRGLWSGEPHRIGNGAVACVAGQRWEWDGVRFSVLHPASDHRQSGNNASCVLRIENAAGALLLTGDIETSVERQLLRSDPGALRARLVVAPHHGSRSSSATDFVEQVDAEAVLFATGWRNRYGFPDEGVAARWRQSGATTFDTAFFGTLGWVFRADGQLDGPEAHRRDARRFWSHDPGAAGTDPEVSSID